MHRIFFFPDQDEPLAAATRALRYAHFHGCFFAQAGDLDRARRHRALDRDQATIFHLDAEEGIFRKADDPGEARARCQRFLNDLDTFVNEGGRFVWSPSTAPPAEPIDPGDGRDLRAGLAALAHLIHCTSFAAAAALMADLDVDARKLIVVPHGNFLPFQERHPRSTDRPLGRKLGFQAKTRVFLAIGQPNLGLDTDRLLESWAGLAPDGAVLLLPQPMLAAAGRDVAMANQPTIHPIHPPRTIVELIHLVHEADLVVLPLLADGGQAGIMLSLSCGRPVLVPAWPAVLERVSDCREAFVHEEASIGDGLERALACDQSSLDRMSEQARHRAASLSWRILGRQLSDGFLRITAGHLPSLPSLEPWRDAKPPRSLTSPS